MAASKKPWKAYGRYGGVGIELVLSILVGYYAGQWADLRWAGGRGWLSGIGFVLGVVAGFRLLFKTAAQMQRDVEEAERQEREEAQQEGWERETLARAAAGEHTGGGTSRASVRASPERDGKDDEPEPDER
jgi:hypothetical protein